MLARINNAIDRLIPEEIRAETSNLMMVRTFVFLHLAGPAMGHSVILFLWSASASVGWQFWLLEANVCFFWTVPLLLRKTGNLELPAALSVQALVFLSLFGSFFYGGISSPFLPWSMIALLIGFFYLAEHTRWILVGVGVQLFAFMIARLVIGDFPELLPLDSLRSVNMISLLAALMYVTFMCLYYEKVMRASGELEISAREHRAKADALRAAMEQAEVASRQKSIFLAKMSHELRTPLNAVIGYSEMLRDEIDDNPTLAQKAEDLDRINAAGRHLLALVTDVLDLSSIEANKQEVSNQPVEIARLIDEVVGTAAPLIGRKDNRMVLEMADDIGTVVTDPLKLRQSILNLLSNAAKFTSRGTITLTAARRNNGIGDRLVITVRDTGIGINEDGLERIFKDFSQAERDTTDQYGGTGLGLALTRRFCKLMGGNVTVKSKPGAGSTFTIDLPADLVLPSDMAKARPPLGLAA
jgi:signal transduction histidine kinase